MDKLATLETIAEQACNEADFCARHNLHDRALAADRKWVYYIKIAAAERTRMQRTGQAA